MGTSLLVWSREKNSVDDRSRLFPENKNKRGGFEPIPWG